MEEEDYIELPSEGHFVHLFTGSQNPCETAVLRLVCMKYGICNWDMLKLYLPWRNDNTIRATICKILKKQAMREYQDVYADPFIIGRDNQKIIDNPVQCQKNGYVIKCGILVNTNWDKTFDSDSAQAANQKKYDTSLEERKNIEIPNIYSLDFLKQKCFKRRQSILIYRAALLAELARREGKKDSDLKIGELFIRKNSAVEAPKASTPLMQDTNVNSVFYDP